MEAQDRHLSMAVPCASPHLQRRLELFISTGIPAWLLDSPSEAEPAPSPHPSRQTGCTFCTMPLGGLTLSFSNNKYSGGEEEHLLWGGFWEPFFSHWRLEKQSCFRRLLVECGGGETRVELIQKQIPTIQNNPNKCILRAGNSITFLLWELEAGQAPDRHCRHGWAGEASCIKIIQESGMAGTHSWAGGLSIIYPSVLWALEEKGDGKIRHLNRRAAWGLRGQLDRHAMPMPE